MKFTDSLFTFPIKIYNDFSLTRALKQEEMLETPMDIEWVQGEADIPASEITGLIDSYSREMSLDDVRDRGFNETVVLTKSMGDFISTWRKGKFKVELDKHVTTLEKTVEQYVQDVLEIKKTA